MRYVIESFFTVAIGALVSIICASFKKHKSAENGIVFLPKLFLIVGIVTSAIFLVPVVIMLITKESLTLVCTFSVFLILCLSIIVAQRNCRIYYDDTDFTVKNFWGIKRTYSYQDIEYICGKTKDVKLYIGKHTVRIDEYAVGKDEFVSFAKKQYRMYHNGNAIPKKIKKDIFNGNVEDPGGIIIGYSVVYVFAVIMIIYSAVTVLSSLSREYESITVSVDSYEIVDNELRIFEKDNSAYYRIFTSRLTNPEKVIEICRNSGKFSALVTYHEDKKESYFFVGGLTGSDGKEYLTLETTRKHLIDNLVKVFSAMLIPIALWTAFVCISIYVGRHPEKFSKKFIRLFFKDGYIRR